MQQGRMETRDGGLLATVLCAGGCKHASHLPYKRSLGPHLSGLIEEITHLCSHVAEAGWRAENDRIRTRHHLRLGDRDMCERLASGLAPIRSNDSSGISSAT